MKKFLLFFISVFGISLSSVKAEEPSWVTKTPADTAQYKYYVACGAGGSQAEALKRAEKEAQRKAVMDNFGIQFETFESIYVADDDEALTSQASETMSAEIAGFKEVERFFNKKSKQVCGLYSYSKKHIKAEKERLKNPKKEKKQTVGVKSAVSGILDLETAPVRDAEVVIDGMVLSKKNSYQNFSLDEGKHSVTVNHPYYNSVTEKFAVKKGEKTKLVLQMTPARIKIKLTTPGKIEADIFMNGEKEGTTPDTVTLFLNRENSFVFKNEEFIDSVKSFKVGDLTKDDDGRTFSIPMEEKSTFVRFTSDPVGAEVFIDSDRIGVTEKNGLKKQISRGYHEYKIYKSGYKAETGSFKVKGGETHSVAVSLKRSLKDADITVLDDSVKKTTVSAAVRKERKNVETPLIDKAHDFTFKPLPATEPFIPKKATTSGYIEALMKWDYPDNFLQAAVSYNYRNGVLTLYPRVFFNKEKYARFSEDFKQMMNLLDFKKSSGDMTFYCSQKGKKINKACSYDIDGATYKETKTREKIKNYRKYEEKYEVTKTTNAVWILENVNFENDLGNIDADLFRFTPPEGKEMALKNIPKATYIRQVVVKVNLTNGQILKGSFPITVSKFKADKDHVEFIPMINDNMRQYIYPIQMGNIPPKKIKSVELYFEKEAE